MRFDVRARMITWLVLVLVPVLAAGWIAVDVAGDRISDRVAIDLANVRRLEAARVNDVLDRYENDVESMAAGPHVQMFTSGVVAARSEDAAAPEVIGGIDGFSVIDPTAEAPLQELVGAMQRKALTSGSEVTEIRLQARDGDVLASTASFSWQPYNRDLFGTVLSTGTTTFGNAFLSSDGEPRVGVVTPIRSPEGETVGAAAFELRLAPITDLLLEHERMGDTSEAHIAQPDPDGNAEFISVLRFERDSAFTKVVPRELGLPINQSLEAPGGTVVRSGDYRQVESILAIETIERTGWGLVVKIDAAEADLPADSVRNVVILAGLAAIAAIVLGWATLLRPLSHRLGGTARAARRVAEGDYETPIGDTRTDEIADMARSIDRLAADLAADIEIRAAAEQRLWEQATHDDLTGLVNRKQLTGILDAHNASEGRLSVLFLDLDGFKPVNDTYGHQVGDEVLIAVAERLRETVGDRGIVARWGGDEFAIALTDDQVDAADEIRAEIHDRLSTPIVTSVGNHVVRASVGQANSEPGTHGRVVLHRADAAMMERKQAARGLQVVSSQTLRAVELALEEGRIEVWYQPIVSLDSFGRRAACGAEVLVRIREVDGTMALPAEFLPAIRNMYLGGLLDRKVIELAFSDLASWSARDIVPDSFTLAVNLSAASTRDPGLEAFLLEAAARFGVDLGRVVIEVSEKTRTLDGALIDRIRSSGVQIAVDDVGVTHSNIDRLVDLRANIAKIDRRWLPDASSPDDVSTLTALRAIIDLCRRLGMRVIAEGIERPEQLALLAAEGVDAFQGYHLAAPAPFDEFAQMCFLNDPIAGHRPA